MPFGRPLLDRLLGSAGRADRPGAPPPDRFPEPIDVIGLLTEAMREGAQNITAEKAVVPSHYTVLLHPEAYDALAPLFKTIADSAADELAREVLRMRHTPYAPAGEPAPEAYAPAPVREVYPLDYTWSVEFCATRSTDDGAPAPKSYHAVATRLVLRNEFEVVDPDGAQARLTKKDAFSGVFETHFVTDANLSGDGAREGVTHRVPFQPYREPARSAAASFYLTYRHPETGEDCRFDLARRDTIVGCVDAADHSYGLRLDVRYAVSQVHAKLRVDAEAGAVAVIDMKSRFGTTVDGQPVPPSDPFEGVERWVPVPVGSEIGLGDYVFLTLHAA